jgi:hypothetical protein
MSVTHKVGDRVKVNVPSSAYHQAVGTITRDDGRCDMPMWVRFDEAPHRLTGDTPFDHHELEALDSITV